MTKQWRISMNTRKELIEAIGARYAEASKSEKQKILDEHGVSSKSCWHMARTPAVQQALSNAWLKAQGLLSVKDLWCKAQGYTT